MIDMVHLHKHRILPINRTEAHDDAQAGQQEQALQRHAADKATRSRRCAREEAYLRLLAKQDSDPGTEGQEQHVATKIKGKTQVQGARAGVEARAAQDIEQTQVCSNLLINVF